MSLTITKKDERSARGWRLAVVMRYGAECARAGLPLVVGAELARFASRLHRLYERQCNEDMGEAGERRVAALQRRAEHAIKAAFVPVVATVEHQTDPRGWPLVVKIGLHTITVPPISIGEAR